MTHPTPADIKAWRESARITQAQAAALLGYSVQAWEHWEQGRRPMRPVLFDLARRSAPQPLATAFVSSCATRPYPSR